MIYSLQNGKFMGWDIGNNKFDERDGHTAGNLVTCLIKHESYILSADNAGIIQYRDLN